MKKVIIYGSGCKTCHKLKALVENIVEENNLAVEVQHSDDYAEMAKLGILSTPAIVIDGKVKSSGTIPNREAILRFIKD